MSPLYLYNGQLLITDGKIAGNQSCCCEPPPPPCEYRYICSETVFSTYQGSINSETGFDSEDTTMRDTIPGQPSDVIRVIGRLKVAGQWGWWAGCPTEAAGVKQAEVSPPPAACCPQPDENWDETTMWTIRQQYHRLRVVDSCEECVSAISYTCDGNCAVGVQANGCVNFSAYTPPQSTQIQVCADALGVDLCVPIDYCPTTGLECPPDCVEQCAVCFNVYCFGPGEGENFRGGFPCPGCPEGLTLVNGECVGISTSNNCDADCSLIVAEKEPIFTAFFGGPRQIAWDSADDIVSLPCNPLP